MLGKYSNVPINQEFTDGGNDWKNMTKYISHVNQQKNFSNLNVGISDAINKLKSGSHSNNVSNSSTPNNFVVDSQNQNYLQHQYHH